MINWQSIEYEFSSYYWKDPTAPPVWARFYEIGTNRFMFVRRDGSVKDKLSEIEQERRAGCSYYVSGAGKLFGKELERAGANQSQSFGG